MRRQWLRNPIKVFGNPWNGPVITVGSGKDYSTVKDAMVAAPSMSLILVFSGQYDSSVETNIANKDFMLRGVGKQSYDTRWYTNYYGTQLITSASFIMIENIQFNATNSWSTTLSLRSTNTNARVYVNKSTLWASSSNNYLIHGNNMFAGSLYVTHSDVVRGYKNILNMPEGASIYVLGVYRGNVTFLESSGSYYKLLDVSPVRTIGYGQQSGSYFIDIPWIS